jgi:exodeoxyribonuclease V alpha subunit
MKLDANQQIAIDRACSSERLSIITGGAGTGKTTIIRNIAEQLIRDGEDVSLAAFAGKAAARMREATGQDASTIHRLLSWNGDRFMAGDFRDQTIIIDEASMVNSALLAEIVRRKPKRLILVGDEAQLPPVGPGQPFHDIIGLMPELVHNLTTCYRATEAVYRAASLVREGKIPAQQDTTSQERWEMRNTGGPRETHAYILNMVKAGQFDFQQDIILSPRNDDDANGAAAIAPLNNDIVSIVNPHADGEKFKVGDRVINTKNNSELDIWNGTTATVQSIDGSGRMHITTDFPCRPNGEVDETCDVDVPRDWVKHFKHAYALTVHKSQGSQYRKVCFVVLGRDAFALLDRAMTYTAITRAKQECLVLGELSAFSNAVRKITNRNTVMKLLAEIYG